MADPVKNLNQYALTAGWRYSSGTLHAAHDYAMPRGTPIFAIADGVIGESNDGVSNNPPGYNPGSGAPSNYVLLWTEWRGKPISVYYQHLSPGLKVRTGQRVRAGERLGESGNTGNSSGDHLHLAAMFGHTTNQYLYLVDLTECIFPPTQTWENRGDEPVTKKEMEEVIDMLLSTKLFADPQDNKLKDVTVRQALRRTYLGHDEPSEV
jgi:murein DD-endopeptidase MepM/ murein hydrolase activator NlpD